MQLCLCTLRLPWSVMSVSGQGNKLILRYKFGRVWVGGWVWVWVGGWVCVCASVLENVIAG